MCSLAISGIVSGISLLKKYQNNSTQMEYATMYSCNNDDDPNAIKVCWEPIELNDTQSFMLQDHVMDGNVYITYEVSGKLKRDGVIIDTSFLPKSYTTTQLIIDESLQIRNDTPSEYKYANVMDKIQSLNSNDILLIEVKAFVEFKPYEDGSNAFSLNLNNNKMQLDNELVIEIHSKELYESCTSDRECVKPLSCVNETCQMVVHEVSRTSVELVINEDEYNFNEDQVILDKEIGEFMHHEVETYGDNTFHRFYFYVENQNNINLPDDIRSIIINPVVYDKGSLVLKNSETYKTYDIKSFEFIRNMLMIHITDDVDELKDYLNANKAFVDIEGTSINGYRRFELVRVNTNIISEDDLIHEDKVKHIAHCNALRSKLDAFQQIFRYTLDCQSQIYNIFDKLVFISTIGDKYYFV